MDQPAEHDFETTVHLVRAAQGGDSGALEDLVSRYLPRVRQIVALRLGRRLRRLGDLDDFVQSALLRVLRGLDRFEQQTEGTFRNWLARCVEHDVVDHARKLETGKRGGGRELRFADCDSAVLTSSVLAGRTPSPSELARAGELAERIEEALLEMPEHHRELVILRAVCGMSYAEVAREVGLPAEGSARTACSRALGKLKERVGLV